MRIFHILNRSFGCRDARDIITLRTCDALAALGHEVFLLIGKGDFNWDAAHGVSPKENLHIVQLPIMDFRLAGMRICSNGMFFNAAERALRRLCRGGDCVIHSRERHLVSRLLGKRQRLGAKIVYDAHEIHSLFGPPSKSEENRRIETQVLNEADGITTGSHALANKIKEVYGDHLKLDVVPFASPTVPDEIPAKSPSDGIFRIFYTGQLGSDRGLDDMIEAAGLVSDCEIHLLGGDQARIEKFRGRAAEAGVADRVIFHGFVNPVELPEVIAQADAFIVPPRAVERMPYAFHTKVFDCMAGGRPIIASSLPSISEVLKHEVNALLVEPGSGKSIAEAIRRLQADPELCERLGAQAFQDVKEYTYEKRAARLEEVFKRVLS